MQWTEMLDRKRKTMRQINNQYKPYKTQRRRTMNWASSWQSHEHELNSYAMELTSWRNAFMELPSKHEWHRCGYNTIRTPQQDKSLKSRKARVIFIGANTTTQPHTNITQIPKVGYMCWSCGTWLPTLTGNRPRRSITQEELRGPITVGVRKSGSPSWMIWREGLGKSLARIGLSC